MTPVEFLGRLCALIPPPRYPLVRYHGVLAPASPWRSRIVPVSTGPKARLRARLAAGDVSQAGPPRDAPLPAREAALPAEDNTLPTALAAAALWAGLVAERMSRYDWAQLLRRIFDIDVLRCPACSDGRLAFIAVVTEPAPVAAILNHLGLPADPPRFARARDPTFDLGQDDAIGYLDGLDPAPLVDFRDT